MIDSIFFFNEFGYFTADEFFIKICLDHLWFYFNVSQETFHCTEKTRSKVFQQIDKFISRCFVNKKQIVLDVANTGTWIKADVHVPAMVLIWRWIRGCSITLAGFDG